MMLLAEDEETQRRGFIAIIYTVGRERGRKGHDLSMTWKGPKLMKAVPIKQIALHCCYDQLIWLPLFSTLQVSFNLFTRLRVRSHYGKITIEQQRAKASFIALVSDIRCLLAGF